MGCKSCGEKRATKALKKQKEKAAAAEVAAAVLEARYSICLNCELHNAGQCPLLHGVELADYARRVGSFCPHPDQRKW